MRRYIARNRDSLESAVLALMLPFVAGAVNASGFFIVGVYTSHVSGSVARVGDELAQGRRSSALSAAILVFAFFCGATLATALVESARRMRRARYAAALLCEASMLLVVTLLGIFEPKHVRFLHELTTSLLCCAMGAQNALVTRLSGAVVRTTHLTGIVTDLGIETVHILSRWRAVTHGQPLHRRVSSLWSARQRIELTRFRLHFGILSSFLVGAIVGPWLYLHHGYLSMLFPVTLLFGLVTFDSLIGFKFRRHAAPERNPRAPAEPLRPASEPPHLRLVPPESAEYDQQRSNERNG
jgi:uncharacterized membrane protein YoaK (UPF0700 family)